jgi:hypothetical protein
MREPSVPLRQRRIDGPLFSNLPYFDLYSRKKSWSGPFHPRFNFVTRDDPDVERSGLAGCRDDGISPRLIASRAIRYLAGHTLFWRGGGGFAGSSAVAAKSPTSSTRMENGLRFLSSSSFVLFFSSLGGFFTSISANGLGTLPGERTPQSMSVETSTIHTYREGRLQPTRWQARCAASLGLRDPFVLHLCDRLACLDHTNPHARQNKVALSGVVS